VLALFAGVGAVALWRRGKRELVVVLLAPLALALVAAFLHKYPYGGSRLEVFAAPAVCLLAAGGVRRVVPVLTRRSRVLAAAVLLLAAVPFGQAAFRVVVPWERAACDEAAAHVLARRTDADRVVVNHWEYEYYFRHRPDGWRVWVGHYEPTDLPAAGGRLWVVHTGHLPDGPFPPTPGPGWAVGESRDFRGVRVFVLHPPGPENGVSPVAQPTNSPPR
jgi:hypothetical protein